MKKLSILLVALMLVLLTACGAKGDSTPAEGAESQTYTGVVQEVKSSMVIVGPTADSADAVVFGTTEEPAVQVGDKVIVTYTGDIEDVGSELNATAIELSK